MQKPWTDRSFRRTTREILRTNCGILKEFPSYDVYDLVRDCEKKDAPPDEGAVAMIAFLAKFERDEGEESSDDEVFVGPIPVEECNIDEIRHLRMYH